MNNNKYMAAINLEIKSCLVSQQVADRLVKARQSLHVTQSQTHARFKMDE